MTLPPETAVAMAALQALLLVLPHALRRMRSASTEQESEREAHVRIAMAIREIEAGDIGMPDNWAMEVDHAVAAYLHSDQCRTFLDEHVKHRVRSMLTTTMLSCAGIRIEDRGLAGLRDEVIQHVRDALRP